MSTQVPLCLKRRLTSYYPGLANIRFITALNHELSLKTRVSKQYIQHFMHDKRNLRIPVKVATQSTGKLPPKPVKAATPSERSDAGGLFLLYLVSCRQICLLFSE